MIIVEYISNGYKHSDVNAATIAIFINKHPEEKIHLFCGDLYFEIIQKLLQENSVNCKNIVHHYIKPFSKQVRDYKMMLFDFFIVSKIFKWAEENNERNILFLYTSTFMLYYVKLFCQFNKNINVQSIVHGDLERVDLFAYAKSFSKGRIWQFLYALFFGLRIPLMLRTPQNLKYIVLGENVLNNAIKLLPNLKNSISILPYPYFYNFVEKHTPFKNKKVRFCVCGLTSERKNVPVLKNLIKFFDEENDNNMNIELAFGGIIMDNNFYNEIKNKSYIDKSTFSKAMIPAEIRDNALKNADYALVTYPFNSYKLVANGSFMDAVNMETPIIATRNNYIEYYFKKYGNIGYMFNSYEELQNKVKNIIQEFPYQEYEIQVNNIRLIKKAESIENIFIDMNRSSND